MIDVSIIITVYNKEKFIKQALNSLKALDQKLKYEYIIIDDGSTDKSLEIIKQETAGLFNTIIISEPNAGPSLAINKAARTANGEFLFFLSGDDVVTAEIQKALAIMKSMGSEVLISERHKLNKKNSIPDLKPEQQILIIEDPIKSILLDSPAITKTLGSSGSLITRDLFEKVGGCDPEVYSYHTSLALKCAKYSKFIIYKKSLAYMQPGSSSIVKGDKELELYNNVMSIYNFITNEPDIAKNYIPELYKQLNKVIWKTSKTSLKSAVGYMVSKLTNITSKKRMTLEDLERLYSEQSRKLL